ncbi:MULTISPECIES: hypothetical protein [unclassified Methanoculleus]|jgi:hypothetical protein|uniref:hypothetical protein n=1 Tax=unclassified Methanoculleus TaxID=2619537 RepID=UPI00319DCB12
MQLKQNERNSAEPGEEQQRQAKGDHDRPGILPHRDAPPGEGRSKEPEEESGGEKDRMDKDPPQGEAEPAKQDRHGEDDDAEGDQGILLCRDPPWIPATNISKI